jgi:hypothetical protein
METNVGRIKEWLETEQQCMVCGRMRLPRPEFSTIAIPICCEKCFDEYTDIMEAMSEVTGEVIHPVDLDAELLDNSLDERK